MRKLVLDIADKMFAEHNCTIMTTTPKQFGKQQKFVYALFLVSSTLTTGGIPQAEQSEVSNQMGIIETIVSNVTQEIESFSPVIDTRAERIDAYFERVNAPLAGQGKYFVEAADKNGIDWTLLPAIAMMESTGGKFQAKAFNPFGWNCPKTCRHGFDNYAEAINIVAENLGGNNERTAKYYANKSTKQILETYNPPSIRADYVPLVVSIMKKIEKTKTGLVSFFLLTMISALLVVATVQFALLPCLDFKQSNNGWLIKPDLV